MLSSVRIKSIEPKEKSKKYYDAEGLYLLVSPTGAKLWRMRYRFAGKEKTLSLGKFPDISLRDARIEAAKAKNGLEDGVDPSIEKQLNKLKRSFMSDGCFRSVAKQWVEVRGESWSEKYRNTVQRRVDIHLIPILGEKPIAEVKPVELLAVIRRIEERGTLEMSKRMLAVSGQIFRYAVATGQAERDISQDLRGALKTRKVVHNPILEEHEIPEFFKRLKNYDGHILTKLAVEFLLLTMVRTKELRGAKWSEIDMEKKLWRVPAERMKMDRPHVIPLSERALEILEQIRQLDLSDEYVFPNHFHRNRVMSENTMLYALYSMGYRGKLTAHGFRGTASTILNEHGFNSDWIERQLAHCPSNSVRAAYNHAQYIPERRKMMEWWAEYLKNQQKL